MSIPLQSDRPSVGVRELKQNASRVLAEVQAENLGRIVTVNGRPVAAIVPLGDIVVDQPGHRVERIGIPMEVLQARMAAFGGPPLSREGADAWMADIRSTDDEDDFRDPFERAGR